MSLTACGPIAESSIGTWLEGWNSWKWRGCYNYSSTTTPVHVGSTIFHSESSQVHMNWSKRNLDKMLLTWKYRSFTYRMSYFAMKSRKRLPRRKTGDVQVGPISAAGPQNNRMKAKDNERTWQSAEIQQNTTTLIDETIHFHKCTHTTGVDPSLVAKGNSLCSWTCNGGTRRVVDHEPARLASWVNLQSESMFNPSIDHTNRTFIIMLINTNLGWRGFWAWYMLHSELFSVTHFVVTVHAY